MQTSISIPASNGAVSLSSALYTGVRVAKSDILPFRAGAAQDTPVKFLPNVSQKRMSTSTSHSKRVKDGLQFLILIFKIATLYSPLKLYLPASAVFFLTGAGYYAFTYFGQGRFTNMSLLLFSAAVIVFLIGLISEQITALNYKDSSD